MVKMVAGSVEGDGDTSGVGKCRYVRAARKGHPPLTASQRSPQLERCSEAGSLRIGKRRRRDASIPCGSVRQHCSSADTP